MGKKEAECLNLACAQKTQLITCNNSLECRTTTADHCPHAADSAMETRHLMPPTAAVAVAAMDT